MAERRPDRTRGRNYDIFWEWCGKGELRLQRCDTCSHIAWPVVRRCESCGGEDLSWAPMTGRGKVVSWNRFHQDYYGGVLAVPYDTILVELEEGPLFVSNPKGYGVEDLSPDMPVKLAFVDAEDSSGVFKLPVFERG